MIELAGMSRPWWQVQHVTFCTPPNCALLIASTISTIRRAVRFTRVSNTQSTVSVPAPGWQSAQSQPSAPDMTPIAAMKSSTVNVLRVLVVTFLKNVPAIAPGGGDGITACAVGLTAYATPAIHTLTMPAATKRHELFMFLSSV